MGKLTSYGLWISAIVGLLLIASLLLYAAKNGPHTGAEPLISLILFVPLCGVGVVLLARRPHHRGIVQSSTFAFGVGALGIAIVLWLDHTNRLVQYDRWLHRGMPLPGAAATR